ncbi:Predicted transcriptional regulator [Blautia wexlerae]|jgi:DNA-binding Xre family transcriptional regulator|uniref:Predicted transcriptional regulator n=1 Tax=Blautia wexlerae TaxID=418240 RepID=A0A174B6V2_9FIRM|nr:helix-turn-helix domain-containing protein [Blautia wexlerae]CUN95486.1 Predicted transcriptional regulator [Blautia wexlerae]DAU63714.1 MAG TPA: Cro/C1-type HTH DNA-binding domain protein [Caudoviricetes sp.]
MISYTPLWHTLINKGMNKGDLKNMTGLSFGTIASMGKNEPVNLKQIDRICKALHCKIEDVIEYKDEN